MAKSPADMCRLGRPPVASKRTASREGEEPMPKRCWFLLLVGVAIGFSGCSVGPDYQPPDVSVPRHFATQSTANPRSAALTGPDADLVQWWRALNDRALDAFVDRAVASNLDIEAALARVQRARIQEVAVIGAALPQVGISAGIAAGTGTDLTKGRVANSLRAGSSTTGLETLSEIIGFDGKWELDIFGKYRRLLEAARDDTEALAELRNAVLITVIADVVRSYINIRGFEARLEFARNNVATAQKTLDIVQTRFDRGLTSEFDVTLAKRQLAVLQARPSDLTAAILAARSRMAILLGTYSEEIAHELRRRRGMPRIPDYLRPGLPLHLLRRRAHIFPTATEIAPAGGRAGPAPAGPSRYSPTRTRTRRGDGADRRGHGRPVPHRIGHDRIRRPRWTQQRRHGHTAPDPESDLVNRTKRLLACPGFRTLGCPHHRPRA